MASTLAEIRAGLQNRLDTIPGLQTYSTRPALPALPCAYPGGVSDVEYHSAMVNGLATWTLSVWVLVSDAKPTELAQNELDLYLDPSGARSVRAAVEGDPTLGGTVDDTVVDSSNGEAIYVTEQGSFYGAEFTLRVLGTGT